MPSLGQRLVAEAVGTFALVFAGCGAIMVDARTQALGHLGVALSFGLVIMIMVSALGHSSGAHFPTTGLWVYLAGPLLGAAASTLLYRYLAATEAVTITARRA